MTNEAPKDDSRSRVRKLYDALRRSRPSDIPPEKVELSLSDLVAITRTRKSKGDTERLKKETQVQKKAELLYRMDPLIFAGVNRLRRAIASPRVYFSGGVEQDRTAMEAWARTVNLKKVLWEAILDIIIYGYSVIEKVRDSKGNIVQLVIVDPKTVDWQKDRDGKILLDDNLNPVGLVQTVNSDSIDLPMKDVVLMNFFTLGVECLGISPLEPAFKASWIRMNLEEAYGEALYRHGFPIIYFNIGDLNHPIDAPLIAEAKKILKNLESAEELILPVWIKPGRLESKTPLAPIVDLWAFLAGEIARALDNPVGFIVPSGSTESKGGATFSNIDFEKAAKMYTEEIKAELDEQLLAEVRIQKKLQSIPEVEFGESSPETQMLRMRSISMLTEKGVLHVDRSLENKLRGELGLPLLEDESKDKVQAINCVYQEDIECPIRKEKNIPLSELFKYCQNCPKTKEGLSKEEGLECLNKKEKKNTSAKESQR
jgi:hypothetical protein